MFRKLTYVAVIGMLLACAGNAFAQAGKGNILFEYWYDIGSGGAVADLTGNENYPDNPSYSEWLTSFFAPEGVTGGGGIRDNYGIRGQAYVVPPETGDYTFWVAGDDYCELWLSTDEDPANAELIADVPGWTPAQDWLNTGGGSSDANAQESDPIPLVAGQKYYIMGLVKEAGGGESIGVAWGGPGIGAGPVLLDGKYCYAFIRDPEPLLNAQNPSPADGAVGVVAPLVQWDAGGTAMWHDLYFGTDPNPPLIGRQPFAMYFHIPGLEPGVTYYWKVDEIEVDGVTIHEGPLWSFIAQDVIAYGPNPADGSGSVSPNTDLTWLPGQGAVKYHLYLGESADAVNEGAAGTDKGELAEATFTPEDLEGATTYHWRVDSIGADGTVQTGNVWSFTTYMLVDDFEGYTDEEGSRIYEAWIDGWTNNTGSTVGYLDAPFAEQSIVHGGAQSMPLAYNNSNSPFYSEAEHEFASTQDWTVGGVTDLSLWVRGYPDMESIEITETGGAMDVTGAGTDIWGTSDEFTYAYKTLNGNGTMVARVVSNGTGSNEWAKGGVMIRQSLNGGSTHSMIVITAGGGNGASFQYREAVDGSSSNVDTVSAIAPPYWVKIERMGDTFSGYLSADGNFWNTLGSMTIPMEDPVHIGVCVTSHAAGEDRTFQFDNISSTGGVSGSWQGAIITAPAHNSAQSFYVVVEDSAGKSAMATDAAAVNAADWTEVKIPLSDLAGVDLTRIKKVYIGVGDRDNPATDGSGMIFIDDIRVLRP